MFASLCFSPNIASAESVEVNKSSIIDHSMPSEPKPPEGQLWDENDSSVNEKDDSFLEEKNNSPIWLYIGIGVGVVAVAVGAVFVVKAI